MMRQGRPYRSRITGRNSGCSWRASSPRRSSSCSSRACSCARLVLLQVVDYERFSELSQGNRFRIEPLPPTRGLDLRPQRPRDRREPAELGARRRSREEIDEPRRHADGARGARARRSARAQDVARARPFASRLRAREAQQPDRGAGRDASPCAGTFPGVDIQEALVAPLPVRRGERARDRLRRQHQPGRISSASTAATTPATSHIGKSGIERSYESDAARQGRLPPASRERSGPRAVRSVRRSAREDVPSIVGGLESKSPLPGTTSCCRSTCDCSSRRRRRSASCAARWSRSIRATATCSRS